MTGAEIVALLTGMLKAADGAITLLQQHRADIVTALAQVQTHDAQLEHAGPPGPKE